MSRCRCCDKKLTPFELTRKDSVTKTYLDMCNVCFKASGLDKVLPVDIRNDLSSIEDITDEESGLDEDSYNR